MTTMRWTIEQIKAVAELLMGAAHADGDYDGLEAEQIGDLLRGLFSQSEMPTELTSHLARFEVDRLDVQACAARFEGESETSRVGVIDLLATLADADGVYDMKEDEFIKQVASALALSEESYEHHTIDVIEVMDAHQPPPVPKGV